VKRILLEVMCVSAVLAVAGCSHSGEEKSAQAPAERPPNRGSRMARTARSSSRWTRQRKKTMGLQTAPLASAVLTPEVKGFGRVVDPAPLAEMLLDFTRRNLF